MAALGPYNQAGGGIKGSDCIPPFKFENPSLNQWPRINLNQALKVKAAYLENQ